MSGSTSRGMHPQAVGEVRAVQKLGLALRGVGLWHLVLELAFGLTMIAYALTMTDPEDPEAPAWIFLGAIAFLVFAVPFTAMLVGISWALVGTGFKSPWLLTLGAGLVGTLIEAVFISFSMRSVGGAALLVGVVLGVGAAYFIIDVTLGGKSRREQARAQDEQAQLLARLRDKGLITEEEYEGKKAGFPSGT